MKKIITLFLIPMIVLSLVGASYALWSKTITLGGTVNTGTVDKIITQAFCSDTGIDPGYTKDVGSCTAEIGIGGDSATFIIDNAYPSYNIDVTIKEKNSGTIPVKINDILMTLSGPGGTTSVTCTSVPCSIVTSEMEVYYDDNFGVQIDPGVTVANSVNMHVVQGAVQGSSYALTVKERAVQWNEYPAP